MVTPRKTEGRNDLASRQVTGLSLGIEYVVQIFSFTDFLPEQADVALYQVDSFLGF